MIHKGSQYKINSGLRTAMMPLEAEAKKYFPSTRRAAACCGHCRALLRLLAPSTAKRTHSYCPRPLCLHSLLLQSQEPNKLTDLADGTWAPRGPPRSNAGFLIPLLSAEEVCHPLGYLSPGYLRNKENFVLRCPGCSETSLVGKDHCAWDGTWEHLTHYRHLVNNPRIVAYTGPL